jgi:hypothetical protein
VFYDIKKQYFDFFPVIHLTAHKGFNLATVLIKQFVPLIGATLPYRNFMRTFTRLLTRQDKETNDDVAQFPMVGLLAINIPQSDVRPGTQACKAHH